MLLSLRNDHKEHISFLITQPTQVVIDFCKLAIDYLQFGPNEKLYNTAGQKLKVDPEIIKNCVIGLIHLLVESCKHKLNEADFKDSVLALGFNEELQKVFSKFYESKKEEIRDILYNSSTKIPHYFDLDWRLEVQVASRCLLHQVTPIICLNLFTQNQSDIKSVEIEGRKEKLTLQTDPVNLIHLTKVLEEALSESKSRHCRRIQKIFQ